MAHHPADGSENDNVGADPAPSLAEFEALKQRLAALEERLPGSAPAEPPRRRFSTKMGVYLAAGVGLAMLAGASLVYGQGAVQSAVDALSISKEGRVGIGTATPAVKLDVAGDARISGGIVGPIGIGTATPAATLDVVGGFLHVAGTTAPTVKSQGAYVGWNALTGSTGETDFINNQGQGPGGFAFMNTPSSGDLNPRKALMFISGAGNVELAGTLTASDKFTGKGDASLEKGLTVAGPIKVNGKNTLEFGAGITKEQSAGQIAYQRHSGDALDIVGAGTEVGKRKIEMWAEGGAKLNGSLNVTGAVDGNVKVVYQRDDNAPEAYQKPLWRYHMSLTAAKYAGNSKTIPKEILTKLCGTADGCEVRLGMTRWDADSQTETASISFRLYYSPSDGRWRVSNPRDSAGVIGDGIVQHAANAWNCYFTDGTYVNGNGADTGTGMQLHVSTGPSKNKGLICELTIIP